MFDDTSCAVDGHSLALDVGFIDAETSDFYPSQPSCTSQRPSHLPGHGSLGQPMHKSPGDRQAQAGTATRKQLWRAWGFSEVDKGAYLSFFAASAKEGGVCQSYVSLSFPKLLGLSLPKRKLRTTPHPKAGWQGTSCTWPTWDIRFDRWRNIRNGPAG